MKRYGDSAIHDSGFQFYLTLNIELYIEKLIHDIGVLEKCMLVHNEWSKEEWYTSKTSVSINESIEGFVLFPKFTLKECKSLLSQRKSIYDTLIELSEKSLQRAVENSLKEKEYRKPFHEDLERKNVIVEDNPVADQVNYASVGREINEPEEDQDEEYEQ